MSKSSIRFGGPGKERTWASSVKSHAGAEEGGVLISADLYQRVFNQVKAEKALIQTKEGNLTAYRILGLKA